MLLFFYSFLSSCFYLDSKSIVAQGRPQPSPQFITSPSPMATSSPSLSPRLHNEQDLTKVTFHTAKDDFPEWPAELMICLITEIAFHTKKDLLIPLYFSLSLQHTYILSLFGFVKSNGYEVVMMISACKTRHWETTPCLGRATPSILCEKWLLGGGYGPAGGVAWISGWERKAWMRSKDVRCSDYVNKIFDWVVTVLSK